MEVVEFRVFLCHCVAYESEYALETLVHLAKTLMLTKMGILDQYPLVCINSIKKYNFAEAHFLTT